MRAKLMENPKKDVVVGSCQEEALDRRLDWAVSSRVGLTRYIRRAESETRGSEDERESLGGVANCCSSE